MKALFSLLLLSSFCLQAQVFWDKTYSITRAGYVRQIIETTDGNYFAVCDGSYVKLNKQGDTLFTGLRYREANFTHFSACAPLPNGEVAIGGNLNKDAFIRIIGRDGNLLRSKTYANREELVSLLTDGNLIYAGFAKGFTLHKTTVLLDSIWSNYKDPSGSLLKIIFDHKGNTIALTNTYTMTGHSSITTGYYFNQPKKVLSGNYPYRSDVIDLVEKEDNRYYFNIGPKLYEFYSFDSVATHQIDTSNQFHFVPDADGITALISTAPGWVFRQFNNNFTLKFEKAFAGKNDFKGNAHIFKDSEGYYLIGGDAEYGTQSRIMKYKPEYLTTGLEETQTQTPFYVYPNPVSHTLHFLPGNQGSLFDQFGQQVIGNTQGEMEVTHLSKGIYFLRLENAHGEKSVEKIVKE